MVTKDNDEHSLKQQGPIEATDFGIIIDVNNEHPSKQLAPI
jgi:hypothetical protein